MRPPYLLGMFRAMMEKIPFELINKFFFGQVFLFAQQCIILICSQ